MYDILILLGGKDMSETVKVTITIPKKLMEKVRQEAKKNVRSNSGMITKIINDHYNKK